MYVHNEQTAALLRLFRSVRRFSESVSPRRVGTEKHLDCGSSSRHTQDTQSSKTLQGECRILVDSTRESPTSERQSVSPPLAFSPKPRLPLAASYDSSSERLRGRHAHQELAQRLPCHIIGRNKAQGRTAGMPDVPQSPKASPAEDVGQVSVRLIEYQRVEKY